MPDLKSIPDEMKWRLAARLAALLPALYDDAFRDRVGEKYDEIEQNIWIDLSHMVMGIIRDLSLPYGYRKRARRQPACRDGNSLWSRLQIRNP